MVIGRGRRREHPNQHFILLLRKKNEKKYTGTKLREQKGREKYRETTTVGKK